MIRLLFLLMLLISLDIFAYSDFDMDGVDNKYDQCPNTLFSELVDSNGCTIKNLASPHNYSIILGINFSQTSYETMQKTDTLTETLQVNYYYKNFSLQANTSYYSSQDDNGLNDSFLGIYYKLQPLDNLFIRLGGGAVFATYDSELNNNNTDYRASLSMSYMLNKINIFGGYSFTMINNDNVTIVYNDVVSSATVTYQNTNSYSVGLGFYPTSKLYISGSYSSSDNIYANENMIKTASIYTFYSINSSWFSSLSYAYGLSDTASDNYVSLRVGYYF